VGDPVPGRAHWTLAEFVGRGSFGEVWRVTHEWKSDVGAVKFCVHEHARQLLASHEKRMVVEAMKQAECHPNIVPLWDYELSGETPWLLYEFVPGGRTLAHEIDDGRTRSVSERVERTARVLGIVAAALGRFHRNGKTPLVHRDLKPDNVMMAGDVPRVTDFGIGGAAVEAAHPGSTGPLRGHSLRMPSVVRGAGNPQYAAPEQLDGGAPDPRNDVFTLGVVAYQMVTGETRTPGANARGKLERLGVPDALVNLIVSSVSDPEDRPPDAAEWAAALAALRAVPLPPP
jgi:serine/threonine protein kinase